MSKKHFALSQKLFVLLCGNLFAFYNNLWNYFLFFREKAQYCFSLKAAHGINKNHSQRQYEILKLNQKTKNVA